MEVITATKPKLGFLGVGWIGKNRMNALCQSKVGEIKFAVDPNPVVMDEVKLNFPEVEKPGSYEAMLDSDVDGIVIATPSAQHAGQALKAIRKGKAVFCQKPLGISGKETAEVVEAAHENDILLDVDFSYRYTRALKAIKKLISSGELGSIYGVQLMFHNAYGPDKSWYYNSQLSGGGCLVDLGIHLIDMLFWIFGKVPVTEINSRLYNNGKALRESTQVEDYAAVQLVFNDYITVQLSCSWNLPVGRDVFIAADFYGEKGGASFRNVKGSFYDFVAEHFKGTATKTLETPSDEWEGRAAVDWAEKLAEKNCFDPAAYSFVDVANTLDLIYHKG